MQALRPEDVKRVRGATMRRDPAREACFTVVQFNTELYDYEGMSVESQRQRLHKHMHNEMQTMEIVAQELADFPDAPWELRMQLARQCWDESRHSALMYRRLRELGGHKGEFPVMNYEWGVCGMLESLPGRLAVQQRTFEGGEMDLLRDLQTMWREAGDDETAVLLDALLADEVQHVRFANRWLKQLAREDSRTLLQVAQGIRVLKEVTRAMAPDPGETNAVGVDLSTYENAEVAVSVEDRRLAEFTAPELNRLLRQEGFKSLAPADHGVA